VPKSDIHLIIKFIKFHLLRFVRALIVGAIGSVEALSIQYFLTENFKLWYVYSGVIGLGIGAMSNYFLNYYWSFKDVIKN